MVMATSLLFGACSGDGKTCDRATQQKGNTENVIGRSDIKVKDGRMTPEVLWAMGRIGGMNVSPDGQKVVYTVAYYSVPENRSNREVFVMNADGTDNKQITKTARHVRPHPGSAQEQANPRSRKDQAQQQRDPFLHRLHLTDSFG